VNLINHVRVIGWTGATKIPPLVYGLAFLFVVIPALPLEEHGRYAIVFSLFALITLLNKLLFLTPMIRFAAEPAKHDRMVRAGVQLSLIFYIIVGLAIWLLAPIFSEMMNLQSDHLYFIVFMLAAIFLRETGFCVQQVRYQMRRIFIMEFIYYIGASLGFVAMKQMNLLNTASDVLWVNVVAAGMSSLVALAFGFGGAKLWIMARVEDLSAITRYGITTVGTGFSAFLNYGVDIQLINALSSPSQVAIYNGAKKVYQIVSSLSQAIALVAMPYTAKLKAERRETELKAAYEKVIGYNTAILAMVVLCGWLFADLFFDVVLGPRYEGSAWLLRLMLLGAPFEGLFIVGGNILYGLGAGVSVALITVGVIAVWVMIALPGVYFLGGAGAAIALAGSFLFAGVAIHRSAAKRLGVSVKSIAYRVKINILGFLADLARRRETKR